MATPFAVFDIDGAFTGEELTPIVIREGKLLKELVERKNVVYELEKHGLSYLLA